ncbi:MULTISPECIES: hypothetical protein [unclassified Acinetobacter]|uniref:hypothetical protein n=1 Tax=unclassified Acinetobacter TaxID=196816 RepID=UPI001C22EE1A|nr:MULTISPECIES: hypothetical protein [unclassified Acinetobacter]
MDYWNSVLLISIITMVGLAMIILFVGCKMWKNLVVTLLIATLIGFLIMCAVNFIFGDRLHFLWGAEEMGGSNFILEMGLMSLLIGGVSTFMIMLGTLVAKSNSRNQSDED